MASYLELKDIILEKINNTSDPREKKELYVKLYRLNEAYNLFDNALNNFGKEIDPDNWADAQANKGSDMSGNQSEGDGIDQAYSGETANNQSFDEETPPVKRKKKKRVKSKNFSLSIHPEPANPDGQLAYSDNKIEHEDDIEEFSCHIPEEAKDKDTYHDDSTGLSYEKGSNGMWRRIIKAGEPRRWADEGTPFFDEETTLGSHKFYVVPGEKVAPVLKMRAGEGKNYRTWSNKTGHLWVKDGKKGTWHRSANRYHKAEDAKAAFEEIRSWKPTQGEDTQATWEEFAEQKPQAGYIYNGKIYKRCPKGMTGKGRTCVPKGKELGTETKSKRKKRRIKKSETDRQIELLSKAKTSKDIQRARKASRRKKRNDSKAE